MTGGPVPGVPNAPLARLDVAHRLMAANHLLETDPKVLDALGGTAARLQVMDALRPYEVQRYAFEVAWPRILKEKNPTLKDDEIAALVPQYCARPSGHPTPTPHQTGGRLMSA